MSNDYLKGVSIYSFENLRCKDERVVFHDVREEPFSIHGLYQPKTEPFFHRLPKDIAEATSEGVCEMERVPAGGRIRFCTDSDVIAIRTTVPFTKLSTHITLVGGCGIDLYERRADGKSIFVHSFKPACDRFTGYEGVCTLLNHGMHELTLNLPYYNEMTSLEVGVLANSQLLPPRPYTIDKPIVFYGSSITQGACCSRPGLTYEGWISRRLDCDYKNYGFAGFCMGEKALVDYLASIPCSAFVCDYDHNAPEPAHLRKTHMPIYRAVRAAQPDVPIIFISRPNYKPWQETDHERRLIIMNTYQTAWNEGDRNVYFVDGSTLFGGDDREECTTDGCHPNDIGFYRMAERIGTTLKYALHLN